MSPPQSLPGLLSAGLFRFACSALLLLGMSRFGSVKAWLLTWLGQIYKRQIKYVLPIII